MSGLTLDIEIEIEEACHEYFKHVFETGGKLNPKECVKYIVEKTGHAEVGILEAIIIMWSVDAYDRYEEHHKRLMKECPDYAQTYNELQAVRQELKKRKA